MFILDNYINKELKNNKFLRKDRINFNSFDLIPLNKNNFKEFCNIRLKYIDMNLTEEEIEEILNNYKNEYIVSYIIECNNKIIGILMYQILYHDLIYLEEIIIDNPNYQNINIGNKILSYLKSLYSIELNSSKETLDFYKNNEFKIIRKDNKFSRYPYILEYEKNC